MMLVLVWLAAVVVPPLSVVVMGRFFALGSEQLRTLAVVSACVCFLACAQLFAVPELARLQIPWPWDAHPAFGESFVRVSEFSAPLVILPAALWLVTVAVTPRGRLDGAGLQRTALATVTATLAFLTQSPILLVLLWALSTLLFLRALSPTQHRRARRVAGYYLWASVALLGAGVALTAMAHEPSTQLLGLGLVLSAVLIRKGIFPFHAWIPHAFDEGRVGPVLLFSAPQLGAYTAAVLVVEHASAPMLRTVAILSLVTAVYGAALALVQRDARRACGYLFVSQSALVMAGLDCTSTEALAGALILWISSALAFTGMARTVLALEARRGRLDLTRHHGGHDQMPSLAASFLVLGLACTGFPGTLGFVGEEMLVEGAVQEFPALGFLVIAASSLTGLAVLRMYFSLFCGSQQKAARLTLLRREAIVFSAVAAALVIGGFAPRSIVASRISASHTILRERADSLPFARRS
jgi:NADH-quinone oxidoreductase subunit M